MVESPTRLAFAEQLLEQLLGIGLGQEMLLVRRFGVAISRRDHHAFDTEVHHFVEELTIRIDVAARKESRICRDAKPASAGSADRADRLVIDTGPADRLIMSLTRTIHVNRKCQVLRWSELGELRFQEQRVRTEVDKLATPYNPLHNLGNLRMKQRLTTRDRDDRSPAFIDRLVTCLRAQLATEDLRRVLNLPAASTRQIASK